MSSEFNPSFILLGDIVAPTSGGGQIYNDDTPVNSDYPGPSQFNDVIINIPDDDSDN